MEIEMQRQIGLILNQYSSTTSSQETDGQHAGETTDSTASAESDATIEKTVP